MATHTSYTERRRRSSRIFSAIVKDPSRKATLMSTEDDIKAAAAELTHAMSQLVRALDAAGDEGVAVGSIPQQLPEELERLAARLNAVGGFGA
jgi:hypothetical protein